MPDFLDLPERPPKPREEGVTHVIDTGLSTHEAEGLMSMAADYVDLVRLGWGTAYVTHDVREKIDRYRAAGVPAMLGGTLTELAWLNGRVDELSAWLEELGSEPVEVSSGTLDIPAEEKLAMVERLAERFTVFAEVYEKDPNALLAPYRWVELIRDAPRGGRRPRPLGGGREQGRLRGTGDGRRRHVPTQRGAPPATDRRGGPR